MSLSSTRTLIGAEFPIRRDALDALAPVLRLEAASTP
jgi:hypothetical protein